jgi:hypothetical protein
MMSGVRQAINEAIDRTKLMDQQGDKGVFAKGYFAPTAPEYLLPDAELQKSLFGRDMEARRTTATLCLVDADQVCHAARHPAR